MDVNRSVEVDASAEAVWEALIDPELRRTWLDDEDSADRVMRIDGAADGESLRWTWWHADDPEAASQVEVTLTRLVSGGTRVAVTERLVAGASASATASASASAWHGRLIGLELLLLAAGVCVA